tara:strand:+ start:502 stop:855 length:354 start_codon:yes stop_codon:yes gene_type:complete
VLDKKTILNSDDLPRQEVEVELWGGSVWVRTLTGSERDSFEESCVKNKGKNRSVNMENIRARLCVLTICNETGERLFDARDVDSLGKKSAMCLDLIFAVAQKLNGLGSDDVEELAKN